MFKWFRWGRLPARSDPIDLEAEDWPVEYTQWIDRPGHDSSCYRCEKTFYDLKRSGESRSGSRRKV